MMRQGSQLNQSPVVPVFPLTEHLEQEVDSSDVLSGLFRPAWPWASTRGSTEFAPAQVLCSAFSLRAHRAVRVDSGLAATHGLGTPSDRMTLASLGVYVSQVGDVATTIPEDLADTRSVGTSPILHVQARNRAIPGPNTAAGIGGLSTPAAAQVSAGVSPEATHFAKRHGLLGSAVLLMSRIRSCLRSSDSVKLDLVTDPEVDGWSILCVTIRTNAPLESAIDLDDRLRETIADSLSSAVSVYFAVRFDLVE